FVFVSIIVNFVLIQGFFERTSPVTFDSMFPFLVVNAIFATVITVCIFSNAFMLQKDVGYSNLLK
nr:hypothetical protein [Candidatus Saccharimonas sp.]